MNHEKRLDFLDTLRGIAASAVFLEHGGSHLFPSFAHFSATRFQVGQFGVSLFFLCSGFVIPLSLEKKKSLRVFWINRLFRLYPLYLASIAFALLLFKFNLFMIPSQYTAALWSSTLWNLSMIQGFFGVEHAIRVYWSLGYEMIFYWIVSFLFLIGLNRRTGLWFGLILVLSVFNAAVARFIFHHQPHVGLFFHFATMFFGTFVFRHFQGNVRARSLYIGFAAALAGILAACGFGFFGIDDPSTFGTRSFLPMLTAWLLAYGVFLSFYLARSFPVAKLATNLGLISYSIYLIHPLVIDAVPRTGFGPLSLAIWAVCVWGISKMTYRWIEYPSIQLGKFLNTMADAKELRSRARLEASPL